MKKKLPEFEVIYCKEPLPENLRAEKYISFIKHLVEVFKTEEKNNDQKAQY